MAGHSKVTSSFRFLGLPKELRLHVYEFLPLVTTHYTYNGFFKSGGNHDSIDDELEQAGIDIARVCELLYERSLIQRDKTYTCTLVVHSAPVEILRACRQVYSEAKGIIHDKVNKIQNNSARLIWNVTNPCELEPTKEIFSGISTWSRWSSKGESNFGGVTRHCYHGAVPDEPDVDHFHSYETLVRKAVLRLPTIEISIHMISELSFDFADEVAFCLYLVTLDMSSEITIKFRPSFDTPDSRQDQFLLRIMQKVIILISVAPRNHVPSAQPGLLSLSESGRVIPASNVNPRIECVPMEANELDREWATGEWY